MNTGPTIHGHITPGMPCITLWQPWASWIALGWKSIETRTHRQFASLEGRRVGIHAGKRWDADAIGIAAEWLTLEQQHRSEEFRAIAGALVCVVHVAMHERCDERHSERALIDCSRTRRYGLFLDDVRPFEPVPMKGAQGIWIYHAPTSNP